MNLRFVVIIFAAVFFSACSSTPKLEVPVQNSEQRDPEQWLELANKSQSKGNHRRALKAYEQVLASDESNVEALKGAAITLNNMEEYEDALDMAQRVLNLDPADVEAAIIKSKILIRFGRFMEAEQMLLQVGEVAEKNWQLWNLLGVVSDMQNNNAEAVVFYKKALKVKGNEPEIFNNLGYSYIMAKDYDKAIGFLHVGLQHKPSSERLRNNLAIAYAWQGKYEKALEVLLAFLPETEAYNNVAYVAMLKEDFKVAKKYYKEAIHYSPVYYRKATLNLEKLNSLIEKKKIDAEQDKKQAEKNF